MHRRTGLILLIAAVLPSCSEGGARPAAVPSPTVPPTIAATVAVTTTTVALIPQTTPDVAANALFTAWRQGDRAAASRVATPAAITVLFSQPPASFSDRGCQDPLGGTSSCAFGVGTSLVTLHTVTLAGGWVVDAVAVE